MLESPKISVVINTLNEEKNIVECIRSVQDIASEVIVCDMYSTDNTVSLAENLGACVFLHEKMGYVEPARYFAISKAKYDWVLVIDADERMTTKLNTKLQNIASENKVEVVYFWSLFWYFGDWVKSGIFFNGEWPMFFRKDLYLKTYNKEEENVHRSFQGLRNSNSFIKLPSEYHKLHYAYSDIEQYVHKTLGRYATIEAENLYKSGKRFKLTYLLLSPIKAFFNSFLLKKGYKDGMRGFILSLLFSQYRFIMWSNLWMLEDFNKRAIGQK